MKRFASILIVLVFLLSAATGCQSSQSAKTLPCPVPGLEWGAEWDSVVEHLTGTGVAQEDFTANKDIRCIHVTPKGIEKLGITGFAGLPVFENSPNPLFLFFHDGVDGKLYFSSVMADVKAADEDALKKALTTAYGQPIEGPTWISGAPDDKITKKDCEKMTDMEKASAENSGYIAWPFRPYVTAELKDAGTQRATVHYHADSYISMTMGGMR